MLRTHRQRECPVDDLGRVRDLLIDQEPCGPAEAGGTQNCDGAGTISAHDIEHSCEATPDTYLYDTQGRE